MKKAEALLDILSSLGRRVVPADQTLIEQNILAALPEMIRRSQVTGGFSFNPRSAVFRTGGEEAGYMMATVPELMQNGIPLNRVDPTQAAVLRLINNPYYMDRLRRGQYLGGWMENGQLVLDPAERFLNKNKSIVKGAQALQQGGFDLYGAESVDSAGNPIDLLTGGRQREGLFYGLDPAVVQEAQAKEALRRLLMAGTGIAAAGGTAGLLGMQD